MRMPRYALLSAAAATALILAASLTLAALAAPTAQDAIPTPTAPPLTEIAYALDTIGGPDWATQTIELAAPEGVILGDTLVESQPPQGITIHAPVSLDAGEISEVSVLVRYPFGFNERRKATLDEDSGEWSVTFGGDGTLPIWAEFEIGWQVVDGDGVKHETDMQPVVYADPVNVWNHSENAVAELFWLGFANGTSDDTMPDALALAFAEQIAAVEPLREAGFGGPLPVKPRRVLVADHATWAALDGRDLDFLSTTIGQQYDRQAVSIRVLYARTTELVVDIYDDCAPLADLPDYAPETADPAPLIASSIDASKRALVQHQQAALLGANIGPNWWAEGQAQYFGQVTPLYDIEERLRQLATLQPLPPLSAGDITVEVTQADGCAFLGSDVGFSFVNWLVGVYGLDAHAEIVALMADDIPLEDAIAQTTGEPFFNVENAWRTYIGFEQLSLADVDPAAALEPYEDAMVAVGDTVTLPATPPIVNLAVEPGPMAIMRGTCFGNTPVEVLTIGALDDVPYYEISCMGLTGWLTRDALIEPQ